jgi:DNA invertase Pin-like site-specific DNA recombinase
LARKYAYQVLLVDEFRRAGMEVIFLNRALGQSPEDDLLLQVQGMIAEYERAKIIERHRRGKRHAARLGAIHVLSGAPYGYRYVTVRRENIIWECSNATGYTGILRALEAKPFEPPRKVNSMLLKGAVRRRQVLKKQRLAER